MANREIKIFCPKCQWEPKSADRWYCTSACGHSWNTFDTGGVCPECGKAWEVTACLHCHRHSPHGDWYHEFWNIDLKEEIEEELPAETTAAPEQK